MKGYAIYSPIFEYNDEYNYINGDTIVGKIYLSLEACRAARKELVISELKAGRYGLPIDGDYGEAEVIAEIEKQKIESINQRFGKGDIRHIIKGESDEYYEAILEEIGYVEYTIREIEIENEQSAFLYRLDIKNDYEDDGEETLEFTVFNDLQAEVDKRVKEIEKELNDDMENGKLKLKFKLDPTADEQTWYEGDITLTVTKFSIVQ